MYSKSVLNDCLHTLYFQATCLKPFLFSSSSIITPNPCKGNTQFLIEGELLLLAESDVEQKDMVFKIGICEFQYDICSVFVVATHLSYFPGGAISEDPLTLSNNLSKNKKIYAVSTVLGSK